MRTVEGDFSGQGVKFAIVASRFNELIVRHLVDGAVDTLVRHGVDAGEVTVYRCPGAWELPGLCRRVVDAGGVDAVVALGAVIRGGTPHFEYVCSQVTRGIGELSNNAAIPVAFGVLTTDTIEQAIERSGTKAGNKGAEAAMAALEMATLYRRMKG